MVDSKLQGQPDEVKADVFETRARIRQGRLRSKILGYGAAGVAALALICWASYFLSSRSYAKVGSSMKLIRDDADRDRLWLKYVPKSTGVIAVTHIPVSAEGEREESDHTTELLPRAYLGQEGKTQQFLWRADGVKGGDIIRVTYKKGWSRGVKEYEVREFIARGDLPGVEAMSPSMESVPIDGAVLSGQIVSALDGEPISGADVRIGGTSLTGGTNSKGEFRIGDIPPGSQKINVTAPGYASKEFDRKLAKGHESAYRIALKPKGEGGNIRVALKWKSGGGDLDGHLEGPLPKGGKFHIDYRHPGTAETKGVVALMTDDQDDGGPETIEVTKVVPGIYRYFVHDFSNRHNPDSAALARSRPTVNVFYGGQSYHFRPKPRGKGNLWDVCTIEVTEDGGIVNRIDNYQGIKQEVLGLYDRRTQGDRGVWITNYGGSVASEKAVTDGLEWLARHQGPDGFWSAKTMGTGEWSQCKGKRCEDAGHTFEMGQTGLALLAFQAGGHYYFNDQQYSDQVRKGLDWIVDHQRGDGGLVSDKKPEGHSKGYHKYYMYDHGIATFALADACAAAKALGQSPDPKYASALARAVRFIYKEQHDDGGWRYTDKFERGSDTSVTGWQVLALKSAREAGIKMEYSCIDRIREFFDNMQMPDHGRTGYGRPPDVTPLQQSDATTGIGMLVRQFLLDEPDHPSIPKAADYLANLAERHKADRTVEKGKGDLSSEYALSYNYYLWYNCTLGMFQAGGEAWDRWNPIIRNTIIGLQRHKGCEGGSWDPDTQSGMAGGRIYTTALACLTLETYYRYTRQQKHTGETELHVVSPGVIPAVVRAEPEPIELHIRGENAIQEISVKPVLVQRPIVRTPAAGTLVRRPLVRRPVRMPPVTRRSAKVGGAKIITVGAAKYGDIQIEAEIEEKPKTFELTLTTMRPRAAANPPILPNEFTFRLIDVTGRVIAMQSSPPAAAVQESGDQALRGELVWQLGPRGNVTIKDLHKLTLGYKGDSLEHSLQTR